MTREEFNDLINRWHAQGLELMTSKSDDYASEENVLQDFDHLHQLCKLLDIRPAERPEDTVRFMVIMKLDRDANLIGRNAQNESRADTLMDMQNYLYLYRAMLEAKGVRECMPDQLEPIRGPYKWPRSYRVAPVTPKTEEAKELK